MMRLALIIPAYKPTASLLDVVGGVVAMDGAPIFSSIILVDDGSGPVFAALFAEAVSGFGCRLVTLAPNRGKGAALRAGFAAALDDPAIGGIVTADADGQHRPDDVVKVARALEMSDSVVLGIREFSASVPLRSRVGNVVTRRLVAACARPFTDTQTGLRGLPRRIATMALAVGGERYEYELSMLFAIPATERIVEVPIATVYRPGNDTSHFRPLVDSWRIYRVLGRHLLARLGKRGRSACLF